MLTTEDADSEERDTGHDSSDSCNSRERVTGGHIQDSLQEVAVCAYCLDGKL